ncbi:MAG: hypothetical protein ABI790_15575 [Betaproteobacteria bacterium]
MEITMEKNPMREGATAPARASAVQCNFDQVPIGTLPPGWMAGVTGRGQAIWRVEADPSAPSPPNVLRQSGRGAFPWCVNTMLDITDGFVEVKFKPLRGQEDQAGGIVWRWKDGDNYYVARANALENNVSLYYTEAGRRNTLQYVDAPVIGNAWHTLRAEFAGESVRILLDGIVRIAVEDGHLGGGGAAGVWTKADSVTAFDDFVCAAVGS